MAAVDDVKAKVPLVAEKLRAVDSGYVAAEPCMARLLERIGHINLTAVQLPDDIEVNPSYPVDLVPYD